MYLIKLSIAGIDFLVNSELPGRDILPALEKTQKILGFAFSELYISPFRVDIPKLYKLTEEWDKIDGPCYLIEDCCKQLEIQLGYAVLFSPAELVALLKGYVSVGNGCTVDFYEYHQDIPKSYLVEL